MTRKRGRPRTFDREKALKQAMLTFWDQGYEGTSMSDLSAAMQLNPPSIYAAFTSKEALFRESVTLYCTSEGARVWRETMAAATAKEAVRTLLRVSAEEFTQADKPKGCLIVLGALFVDSAHKTIYEDLHSYRAENIARLVQRLRQGAHDGEFTDKQDWHTIATFYITVQQGMSLQAKDGASRQTLLDIADNAMAAWHILLAS